MELQQFFSCLSGQDLELNKDVGAYEKFVVMKQSIEEIMMIKCSDIESYDSNRYILGDSTNRNDNDEVINPKLPLLGVAIILISTTVLLDATIARH